MVRAWSFQLLKPKKRVFLSLICLFLTVGIALADGNRFTISGRVQTENGQPPPSGTTVQLSTRRGGLVAQQPVDTDGGFVFDGLLKGTYELTASAKGFVSATKEIDQRFWVTDVFVTLTLTQSQIRETKPGGILRVNDVIPESARKSYKKGKKAYKSGDLPRAEEYLEKAVKEHSCYPEAQVDLSIVAGLRHENSKAEGALRTIVECNPEFLPAYFRLGFLLNAEKRFEESVKVLQSGLSLSPESGELHHQLALAMAGQGQYANAEQEYLKVLSLEKQPQPRIHAELANVYLRQDKYADAYQQMKAYVKAAPKGPLAPAVRKSMQEMKKSGVLANSSQRSSDPPQKPQ